MTEPKSYRPCRVCNGYGWHWVEEFDPQSKSWISGDDQEDCLACNGTGKAPLTPVLKAIEEQFSLNYLGNQNLDFDDCWGDLAFDRESEWFSNNDYALYPGDSDRGFCLVHGEDVWEIGFDGNGDRAVERVKAIINTAMGV